MRRDGRLIVDISPSCPLVLVTWGLLLSLHVLNRHITPSDPRVSESIHRSVYNTIITRGVRLLSDFAYGTVVGGSGEYQYKISVYLSPSRHIW